MFDNMTKKIIAGLSVFIIVFSIVCVPIVTKADDGLSLGVYHKWYYTSDSQDGYVFHDYTSLTSDLINNIDTLCDNINTTSLYPFPHMGSSVFSTFVKLGLGNYIENWDYLNPSFYITCYYTGYGFYFIFTGNSSVATPSTTNVENQFTVRSTPVILFTESFDYSESSTQVYISPKVFVPTLDSDRYSIGYYNLSNGSSPSGLASFWGYSADIIDMGRYGSYQNSVVGDDVFLRRYDTSVDNSINSDISQCGSLLSDIINGSKKYFSVYIPVDSSYITQTNTLSPYVYVSNKIMSKERTSSQMLTFEWYVFSYINIFDGSHLQLYTHSYSTVYNFMSYGFTSSSIDNMFDLVLGRFIYRGGGGSPIVTPTPIPSLILPTPTLFPTVSPSLITPTPIPNYYSPDVIVGFEDQDLPTQLTGYSAIVDEIFTSPVFACGRYCIEYLASFSPYFNFVLIVPIICLLAYVIGRFNQR